MTQVPNDPAQQRRGDPAVRLRGVPGAGGGDGEDRARGLRRRLPAHRHRRRCTATRRASAQALAESGLSRDEVFITTKLNNDGHGFDAALKKLDESLAKLRIDHVDLYLIHWPRPREDRYVETWKGFEKALADGKARSIGVSNFTVANLERLAKETDTVPAVNQIELHPHLVQRELRNYHVEHGIATEAWSPIAQGGDLLTDGILKDLAEKYGKTPAQVVLRWHVQLGNIVFPKSMKPERMRENIDVFDFELSNDDMDAVAALDRHERTGPDPDNFG